MAPYLSTLTVLAVEEGEEPQSREIADLTALGEHEVRH